MGLSLGVYRPGKTLVPRSTPSVTEPVHPPEGVRILLDLSTTPTFPSFVLCPHPSFPPPTGTREDLRSKKSPDPWRLHFQVKFPGPTQRSEGPSLVFCDSLNSRAPRHVHEGRQYDPLRLTLVDLPAHLNKKSLTLPDNMFFSGRRQNRGT